MEYNEKTTYSRGLRKYLPTALIVLSFAIMSLVYFAPAVLDGKELFQNDVAGASGTAQDVRTYEQQTGEVSYWTNSLFSGMPMYQIAPSYPSLSVLKHLQDLYTLQWPLNLLPSYSWLLFAMLLGFFIFLRLLGVRSLLSALGAVMWALSSYFIILIDAGHIWKLMVLSFIPPTIGGIVDIYRGNYLRGGVITAFFASLQLMSNHIQMSYYFAFLIVLMLVAYLVEAIREKRLQHFAYATLTLLAAAAISISTNSSNLYHTYKYTQETMRGGSALSDTSSTAQTKASGLDKEYITQWSYGKAETLTFLVPNTYGGATGYLGHKAELVRDVPQDIRPYLMEMNQYWGDQPFTSGPVYVGAFVLFLAILGAIIVRTPLKWALVGATLLSIALSWGHNMMWLTDLFIDYFPLYNKFRTVSSILVIAEFTIPTLAVLGLVEFVREPRQVLKQRTGLMIALGATAGVSLLLALAPSLFFDFLSDQESQMFAAAMSEHPIAGRILTELRTVRADVVSADAWRSLAFIILGLSVCILYAKDKISSRAMILLLALLTLVDLWSVDKRYLNDDKFIPASLVAQRATPVHEINRKIAEDKDPHYRVLNLATSTFQDATTSYMHRSVGGYHAAKLSRYQDLIEHQISRNNTQVLNMLDVRYVISADAQGGLTYSVNEAAFGAAWFVDTVKLVNTAPAEMSALGELDLRSTAVVHEEMALEPVRSLAISPRGLSQCHVHLTTYTPNRAEYSVQTDQERLLVFSEIYYPHGWQLWIDDQPAEIIRANYLLRAAVVPAGRHKLVMRFEPHSIEVTETLSFIAQMLLASGALLLLVIYIRRTRNS